MRLMMIPAVLVTLAGCAATPDVPPLERMTSLQLCEAVFFPPAEGVAAAAEQEAVRRGVNCANYRDQAIQMQNERELARAEAMQYWLTNRTRAPQAAPPVVCRTIGVGASAQTVCR